MNGLTLEFNKQISEVKNQLKTTRESECSSVKSVYCKFLIEHC
jgi:hypothetical protein